MPRKSKVVVPSKPTYYAYYDKQSGQILSVTNEKNPKYEFGVEIQFDDYEKLVTGKVKFEDCAIGKVGSSAVLELVPAGWQGFKNNLLELVCQDITADTEVAIFHSSLTEAWRIELSNECKDRVVKTGLAGTALFFVILGDDFNFLVRTIPISISELLNKPVIVPFESQIEYDFAKVSIATKVLFNSYGIIHE